MSDFEEKLESILSNPQAMEQIMSLAQSLGGKQEPAASTPPSSSPVENNSFDGLLGGLGLGQLDPRILTGAMQLLNQYQSNDDGRVALLNALRPFVKEQ